MEQDFERSFADYLSPTFPWEGKGSLHAGYVVQAFKVLKNLVYAEANARAQKNWIFCRFPNPKTISLRDYQLILCMFGFLH